MKVSSNTELFIYAVKAGFQKLTPREWEVVVCLSEGLTSPEIAKRLYIEPKSAENYRNRIAKKLNLRGRHTLTRFCWSNQESLKWLRQAFDSQSTHL